MVPSITPTRPTPVTPWLDHGVYSAWVSASRNASGMDAGIEYRHDEGMGFAVMVPSITATRPHPRHPVA